MKDGKFEVGDEVECVNAVGSLIKGKKYVVYKSFTYDGDGMEKISLEGVSQLYYADRFKLVEPAFTPEYFSALNEKESLKYIGKVMEFADGSQVRNNDWLKGTLSEVKKVGSSPFHVIGANNYIFMRTCPETFKKKKVTKTIERWAVICKNGTEWLFEKELDARKEMWDKSVLVHLLKEYEIEE